MTSDQAMTIRLPAPLYEQLRKAAFDQHVPMNRIIVAAVTEQLARDQHARPDALVPSPALGWMRTTSPDGVSYAEHLNGIPWHDAPLPPRGHRCRAQTRGQSASGYAERCACGAIRLGPRLPWMERNERKNAGDRPRPR